jgi:hypothetical protein
MKRLLLMLTLCGAALYLNAQSNKTIYLQTGEQIEYSKFRDKKPDVKYTTTAGNKHVLKYDDIHFILKKNTVYVPSEMLNRKFLASGPLTISRENINTEANCTLGMVDAIGNNHFTGAKLGGVATGLLIPIGLIGTAVIAEIPPSEQSLKYPANAPIDDQQYKDCYRKTIKKQKRTQTWIGAVFGSSLALCIYAAVISSY